MLSRSASQKETALRDLPDVLAQALRSEGFLPLLAQTKLPEIAAIKLVALNRALALLGEPTENGLSPSKTRSLRTALGSLSNALLLRLNPPSRPITISSKERRQRGVRSKPSHSDEGSPQTMDHRVRGREIRNERRRLSSLVREATPISSRREEGESTPKPRDIRRERLLRSVVSLVGEGRESALHELSDSQLSFLKLMLSYEHRVKNTLPHERRITRPANHKAQRLDGAVKRLCNALQHAGVFGEEGDRDRWNTRSVLGLLYRDNRWPDLSAALTFFYNHDLKPRAYRNEGAALLRHRGEISSALQKGLRELYRRDGTMSQCDATRAGAICTEMNAKIGEILASSPGGTKRRDAGARPPPAPCRARSIAGSLHTELSRLSGIRPTFALETFIDDLTAVAPSHKALAHLLKVATTKKGDSVETGNYSTVVTKGRRGVALRLLAELQRELSAGRVSRVVEQYDALAGEVIQQFRHAEQKRSPHYPVVPTFNFGRVEATKPDQVAEGLFRLLKNFGFVDGDKFSLRTLTTALRMKRLSGVAKLFEEGVSWARGVSSNPPPPSVTPIAALWSKILEVRGDRAPGVMGALTALEKTLSNTVAKGPKDPALLPTSLPDVSARSVSPMAVVDGSDKKGSKKREGIKARREKKISSPSPAASYEPWEDTEFNDRDDWRSWPRLGAEKIVVLRTDERADPFQDYLISSIRNENVPRPEMSVVTVTTEEFRFRKTGQRRPDGAIVIKWEDSRI